MQEVSTKKEAILSHLGEIVEKLMKDTSLYQERLDKDEMIELMGSLFNKFSIEELKAISDRDLTDRIDRIMVIEAVSGTLNDLTPEQIAMYDEAVGKCEP